MRANCCKEEGGGAGSAQGREHCQLGRLRAGAGLPASIARRVQRRGARCSADARPAAPAGRERGSRAGRCWRRRRTGTWRLPLTFVPMIRRMCWKSLDWILTSPAMVTARGGRRGGVVSTLRREARWECKGEGRGARSSPSAGRELEWQSLEANRLAVVELSMKGLDGHLTFVARGSGKKADAAVPFLRSVSAGQISHIIFIRLAVN